MPSIEQIPAYLVWPIRHQAMYPELNLEDVKIENDDDATHLGLFDHNKLISVVSLFQIGQEIRFRKFATLTEYQNMGYGSLLLEYMIGFSKEQNCKRIWCNARKAACDFYKKYHFQENSQIIEKADLIYVIMELNL
ncbi:MAG TPA: GNAT family N-acetyltransferase [Sphingobacteriaceae bacterium]|nr:GNAT family N-acetyltransferase [Sphingobacteriaceae bacterium]